MTGKIVLVSGVALAVALGMPSQAAVVGRDGDLLVASARVVDGLVVDDTLGYFGTKRVSGAYGIEGWVRTLTGGPANQNLIAVGSGCILDCVESNKISHRHFSYYAVLDSSPFFFNTGTLYLFSNGGTTAEARRRAEFTGLARGSALYGMVATPIPAAAALFAPGLAVLGFLRRRRQRR